MDSTPGSNSKYNSGMRRSAPQILLALALLFAHGCDRAAPHVQAPQIAPLAPGPAAIDTELDPVLEEDTFRREAKAPSSPLDVGKPRTLELVLQGRNGWHVNQEYPIQIELDSSEQLALASRTLTKDAAKSFTDDLATFAMEVTPEAAGQHWISCAVSFAMCTKDNCVLEKRSVRREMRVN